MLWRIQLWLARHLNWWTYHGLRDAYPKWWPEGVVIYDDGGESTVMALGNAVDYADMFSGHVVKP